MFQRFLAAAFGCLIVLAAPMAAGARDDAWPAYSNAEFGFSARFPGVPQVQTKADTAGNQPITQLIASYDLGGDSGLIASAARFQADIPDPQAALRVAAQSMANDSDLKVVSDTQVTVQGIPAERLVVAQVSGDYRMSLLFLVKGPMLYTLAEVGHGTVPKEAEAFQNSFALLPAQ
jgi:hypothetical protein